MSTLPLHESTRGGGGGGGAGCGAGCGVSARLVAGGPSESPPHDVDAAERTTVRAAARRTRFEKYRRATISGSLRRRLAILQTTALLMAVTKSRGSRQHLSSESKTSYGVRAGVTEISEDI